MPHIPIPEGLPGIRGLFAFRPETAQPMSELAEALLHAPGTLTPGERELIATYVSLRNDCYYCQTAHGAIAAQHLGGDEEIVDEVKRDFEHAAVSDKLKALLAIAGKVQRGGKNVQPEDIERARREGATDREIHDTVLIAAAFCMYNRYVDGLATWAPREANAYRDPAARLAREGYVESTRELASAPSGAAGSRYASGSLGAQVASPSTYRLYIENAAAMSTVSWMSRSVAPCSRAASISSFVTLLPSIWTCSAIASNAFSFSEIAALR